jgi:hypothetical protein
VSGPGCRDKSCRPQNRTAMKNPPTRTPVRDLFRGRFFPLLVILVLYLAAYPYLWDLTWGPSILDLILIIILLSGVFSMRENRTVFYIGIALGTPAVLTWFVKLLSRETPVLDFITLVTIVPFFAYAAVTTLYRILKARTVTRDEIFGAAALYLLIGVTWGVAYGVLEYLHPGNFSFKPDGFPDFIYFSFVTMTTLGYGDMLPVSNAARSLAILESATGVLYMASLIARLVGAFESTRANVPDIVSETGEEEKQ